MSDALKACPVPLLYLRAADDRVVSAASWRRIAKIKPDAYVEIVSSPHLVLQMQPALAIAAIERFLIAHH